MTCKYNTTLTYERLREVLSYDPVTGNFYWLPRRYAKKVGEVAGFKNKSTEGYIVIWIQGVRHKAHRLAWLYMTGNYPKNGIDHIDMNRSNNKFSNLREANQSQNNANCELRHRNKSGVKGVYWNKAREIWVAQIAVNKKNRYLGSYATKEEAGEAYKKAAEISHGEFARA